MKKLLCILLVAVALIGVTGCGETKKEPTKIALTGENFSDYIILNVDIKNFKVEEQMGLVTRYEHRGVADLVAKARLKKDVKVEDVVIKGKITTGEMGWALKTYEFTLELDKDGEADFSEQITSGDFGLLKPKAPTMSKFYTYELKDGEFFLKDKELLITSLEGNVIEE